MMNQTQNGSGKIRAVYADDKDTLRMTMEMLLPIINPNIELKMVENGRDLVSLVQQEKPDVLITDNEMPYLHGVEAIAQLRMGGYTGKSLVVSGNPERFEQDLKTHKVTTPYLAKPYGLTELKAKLQEVWPEYFKAE